MKKQGAGSRFTGACMVRVKIGKLILPIILFVVVATSEIQASIDSLPQVDTSFAYRVSHAVTPLSSAVIEMIADRDDELLSADDFDDFDLVPMELVALRTSTTRTMSRDGLCSAVAAVARANDLPIPFFANLIWKESSFNAKIVSRAGAQGIAQFMPRTAFEYGLVNPFEPIHALNVAGRMLRELSDQFGNVGLAAAAYNAGPRRVTAWLARRGELPTETLRYVTAVTGHSTEEWAKSKEIANPDMSLMPAKAPCVEVADAVEAQAQVVRLSKLIAELEESATALGGVARNEGKPDGTDAANGKPSITSRDIAVGTDSRTTKMGNPVPSESFSSNSSLIIHEAPSGSVDSRRTQIPKLYQFNI
jgi:hypothetical protein